MKPHLIQTSFGAEHSESQLFFTAQTNDLKFVAQVARFSLHTTNKQLFLVSNKKGDFDTACLSSGCDSVAMIRYNPVFPFAA